MDISVSHLKLPEERERLVSFLLSEPWPFHSSTHLTRDKVNNWIDAGEYSPPNTEAYWVLSPEGEQLGMLRIFDLEDIDDGNPLFDLRIKSTYRGKGAGRAALTWMTQYLFHKYPGLNRIEGNTRADNTAMRRVFQACGYIKEGHFRAGWSAEDGSRFDSVHYGIIRRDWETGNTTPVPRNDD